MNRRELRAKLIRKGVSPETVPYIFKALTATNHTLIEFDGSKSEVFNGSDGIVKIIPKGDFVDLLGKHDERHKPDTFVRITEPRRYLGGYTQEQGKFELNVGIQTSSGAIIATRTIPGSLGLSSRNLGYYSPEAVKEYMKDHQLAEEEKFDIIFHVDPTKLIDLKRKKMSYREPFEPSKLIGLFKNEDEVTKEINGLINDLVNSGIPIGVALALPKVLEASNRTFVGTDGKTSRTFIGYDGLMSSNIGLIYQNDIKLTGYNSDGLPDVLVQIKEPHHFESGEICTDPIQLKIAIFSEDGSIFVTTAYPKEDTLFSPKVSVYSSKKVERYRMANLEQIIDTFDIIFQERIEPDSTKELIDQEMSYRTPFETSKLKSILEGSKRKQIRR